MLKAKSIVAVMLMGMLAACGVVGAPVPPETVGVNPTIERQKKVESLEERQREAAIANESTETPPDSILQGQDIDLPPSQPVGIR